MAVSGGPSTYQIHIGCDRLKESVISIACACNGWGELSMVLSVAKSVGARAPVPNPKAHPVSSYELL